MDFGRRVLTIIKKSRKGYEIRLDDTMFYADMLDDMKDKLNASRAFLMGANERVIVSGKLLDQGQKTELKSYLRREYNLRNVVFFDEAKEEPPQIIKRFPRRKAAERHAAAHENEADELKLSDSDVNPEQGDAPRPANVRTVNTVFLQNTVRSGQRIESFGDIIVVGDVNPGAEVIADGSIAVFGRLMGLAHAGARGDRTACVVANRLTPSQLRICGKMVIVPRDREPEGTEIATLNDDVIEIKYVSRRTEDK